MRVTEQRDRLAEALRERDEALIALKNYKAQSIHTCHDQCQQPMCVLRRERDEARSEIEKLKEELESHAWTISPAMAQAKIDELVEQRDRLAEVAHAVWDRWETPLWKDHPPTALVMNKLRDALTAVEGGSDE
jgi:chromosome segregation ATPase